MDKKTILAVVLCTIVITVSMIIQSTFFAGESASTVEQEPAVSAEKVEENINTSSQVNTSSSLNFDLVSSNTTERKTFNYETEYFDITFDNKGAGISSIKLKEHEYEGEPIDLLFRGESDPISFLMYLGNDFDNPVDDVFNYTVDGHKVIFSQTFVDENGKNFTINKTFEFRDKDYLFTLNVEIVGESPIAGEYAYSIEVGPQIGPEFKFIKNDNYNYRRFYSGTYQSGGKTKKKTLKTSNDKLVATTDTLKWMSVSGKYFNIVGLPEDSDYTGYALQEEGEGEVSQFNSFYLSKQNDGSASQKGLIYFYAGPQLKQYMGSYYSPNDNEWGIRNLDVDEAVDSSSWLGWLESILKFILNLFYKIIPNYGIAIILMTLLIKVILYPLTKKSLDSTAKMSSLGPMQKEIQEKYKDNPTKMNQEIQALYKKEGVSPMSGCLPMLVQFPIFIALFNLLNKHFELRGAMFIPGWIPDLSIPDQVFTLSFNIPLLGPEIHILPIIYAASMILSMKISQSGQQNQMQGGAGAFMSWGMPIIFFFVLYNSPSGLLLYWTVQNIISIAQQKYTNWKKVNKPVVVEEKVPEVVRKYREKMKKIETEKGGKNKTRK